MSKPRSYPSGFLLLCILNVDIIADGGGAVAASNMVAADIRSHRRVQR